MVVRLLSYPRLDAGFGWVMAREGEAAGEGGGAAPGGEKPGAANGAAAGAGAPKDPFDDPNVQKRVNDIVARELAKVDRKYEKELTKLQSTLDTTTKTFAEAEAERKRLAGVVEQLERAGGGDQKGEDPEDLYEELERFVKPPDDVKDPVARRIWIRMKRGELSASEALAKMQKNSEQQEKTVAELNKKLEALEQKRLQEEERARQAVLQSAIDRSVTSMPGHQDDTRGLRNWFTSHIQFGDDGDLYYQKDGSRELLRLDDKNITEIADDIPTYYFKPKTKGGSGAQPPTDVTPPSQQDLAKLEADVTAAEAKARASGRQSEINEAIRLRNELYKLKAKNKK